jgi:hypothetical protein
LSNNIHINNDIIKSTTVIANAAVFNSFIFPESTLKDEKDEISNIPIKGNKIKLDNNILNIYKFTNLLLLKLVTQNTT